MTQRAANDSDLVASDTGFGLDLYDRVRDGDGNRAVAPTSIAGALAMAYAGARGETARQMAQVLRVGPAPDAYHEARAELRAAVQPASPALYQLQAASALWGQSGEPFRDDYLELVRKHYGAGLRPTDFVGDPRGSTDRINAWVAEQTSDKITNLIGPGVITALTRLVLTDALYFLGGWVKPFPAESTRDQRFHRADGNAVNVPLMSQRGYFRLYETDDLQVLEMPYLGNTLAMWIALPTQVDGLDRLEESLSSECLDAWRDGLQLASINLSVPRFRIEAALRLIPMLRQLGMTAPFNSEADFSGIAGKPHEYFISDVLHNVFVNVNEQGTEAAAATAVVLATLGGGPRRIGEPKTFRADHPFLFLIRHNPTGAVIFLGRVTDPRG